MTYIQVKTVALMFFASIFLMLNGCGGNGGSTSGTTPQPVVIPPVDDNNTPPPPVEPIQVKPGITVFNQTVPVEDDDSAVFPGQANYWDLDTDGSIDDGYDDQFDGAIQMA